MQKHENVATGLQRQGQNSFAPGGPHWGMPPNLGVIWGYPRMWTAKETTILILSEDLTRYLLAFLALNYVPNSETYVLMNFSTRPGSEIRLFQATS